MPIKGYKRLKVFCGYVNTGGIAYKIADGLRKNGIKADSIVIDEHLFSYPSHKQIKFFQPHRKFLNRLLKYCYFIKHFFKYNIFIFNTRSTLLSRKVDLKILRLFGKKTAMVYVGCDIRDKNHYLKSDRKFTVCKDCTDNYQTKINCLMEDKITESAYIQKNINASFSHPFDAMILNGKFNYLYLLLELEKYSPKYAINNKIKIIHAPSDDGIKGTKYVMEAIEELKKNSAQPGIEFDFELLRNKSHEETIDAIQHCDILIDQMTAGWYGLISIEAMALGKTTVCYIDDKLYSYLPDLPIINLTPDNLAEGLKTLIADKDKLSEHGKLGRGFVEKYHDHVKNSKMMLDITTGRKI